MDAFLSRVEGKTVQVDPFLGQGRVGVGADWVLQRSVQKCLFSFPALLCASTKASSVLLWWASREPFFSQESLLFQNSVRDFSLAVKKPTYSSTLWISSLSYRWTPTSVSIDDFKPPVCRASASSWEIWSAMLPIGIWAELLEQNWLDLNSNWLSRLRFRIT